MVFSQATTFDELDRMDTSDILSYSEYIVKHLNYF